jgi:Ca2+-binding EF-hand superfamily protein
MVGEKRSIFGDGIFELVEINHSGKIDFGEWFQTIVTYCLFEREQILKFCFYIFDRDKNGYIEQDELMIMINVL